MIEQVENGKNLSDRLPNMLNLVAKLIGRFLSVYLLMIKVSAL